MTTSPTPDGLSTSADAPPHPRARERRFSGPGWLVAAAFVGPGTVTTATLAGARFGTALIWALVFSIAMTMVLQEMAARLGLVTGAGLGEALRTGSAGPLKFLAPVLVVGAIALGNAAYQTGNLLGGALGLEAALGGPVRLWVVGIGVAAAALLWRGSFRLLERGMTILVGVMGIAFVITAVRVLPRVEGLGTLLPPAIPEGGVLTVVGLIGTTVVPYNLFLHAGTVRERFGGREGLREARVDLVRSIAAGGVVSVAILVTAAGTLFGSGIEVTSAAEMAGALEPVLGGWARFVFAIGLFAAGMTSAVTAPLAAALATAGALGWRGGLDDPRLRAVWGGVL
ncbi:MAG: Nramp family divalent metal transporter, partial [Longimicrobiales bacterium]|nr:Nramp family divalent metal transporter [Longimicrobiales bacterium]